MKMAFVPGPGVLLFGLLASVCVQAAQPLTAVQDAVAAAYGKSTVEGTRLVQSAAVEDEPKLWHLFADDPHRPGELVKIGVTREADGKTWSAQTLGSGELLQRVPPAKLDLAKVKVGPVEARRTAEQGAALARVTFVKVGYQLVTQVETGIPEWALTLYGEQGHDIGFVVVSAETGAVIHQDFSAPEPPSTAGKKSKKDAEIDSGEDAARAVKRGMRRAWDWTEHAGRETKGFFRELFR